jgi:hypothetical protein
MDGSCRIRFGALLALAGCLQAGCVTNPSTNEAAAGNTSRIEKVPPSPTANLNPMEKTGYYLGWFALESLYRTAASNPSF